MLRKILVRSIAPPQDGMHLFRAVEQEPGANPCLSVRADEVGRPVIRRHVYQDTRHKNLPKETLNAFRDPFYWLTQNCSLGDARERIVREIFRCPMLSRVTLLGAEEIRPVPFEFGLNFG